MENVQRIRFSELPYQSIILQYALENGVVSLWLDLGNGKKGLLVTKDQRVYQHIAEGVASGKMPIYAVHRGAHRPMIVWSFAKQSEAKRPSQKHTSGEKVASVKRMYINVDEGLIDAIIEEMARVWGGTENFEGTYEQYNWLLEHYGITEKEDVWWQIILDDKEGESRHPEDAEDEKVISFLRDEQAIHAFLDCLLKKYGSNMIQYRSQQGESGHDNNDIGTSRAIG